MRIKKESVQASAPRPSVANEYTHTAYINSYSKSLSVNYQMLFVIYGKYLYLCYLR